MIIKDGRENLLAMECVALNLETLLVLHCFPAGFHAGTMTEQCTCLCTCLDVSYLKIYVFGVSPENFTFNIFYMLPKIVPYIDCWYNTFSSSYIWRCLWDEEKVSQKTTIIWRNTTIWSSVSGWDGFQVMTWLWAKFESEKSEEWLICALTCRYKSPVVSGVEETVLNFPLCV